MMESQYIPLDLKTEHEMFVSGQNGSNVYEISVVASIAPLSLLHFKIMALFAVFNKSRLIYGFCCVFGGVQSWTSLWAKIPGITWYYLLNIVMLIKFKFLYQISKKVSAPVWQPRGICSDVIDTACRIFHKLSNYHIAVLLAPDLSTDGRIQISSGGSHWRRQNRRRRKQELAVAYFRSTLFHNQLQGLR